MAESQLLLPFGHEPVFTAADFVAGESNREALAWLSGPDGGAGWPDRRLALFGPAGCGKSHLLHIWRERSGAVLLPGPGV
ncbi:MAG: chromosomal replication initiator DnaA, partial [Rhodospirillales bacterium]|nr:chromosomal replication initiator DnaA [Rhodospirillales bacterium]